LLFLQANVVSVDTSPVGAPAVTLIEVTEARLLEEAKTTGETLFGPVEVVLATTVLEGIDMIVTLGESYLQREVTAAADETPLPEDTVPGSTVDADG
jgi:hypothetical protein